jgi:hypothetical protein
MLLLHTKKRGAGRISQYVIPTKAEAEITAYVLPEFRNIGIFTKMLKKPVRN